MTTIVKRDNYDDIPVISRYTADDAIQDGTLLALCEPEEVIPPIHQITGIDDYLRSYGKPLGKKAITALTPLHVPGRDPLPDFSDLLMELFPAQQHVVAAAIKMFNARGSGFLCGECGVGKTKIGMAAVYEHAKLSRNQGGYGGCFRAIVLCPDHLVGKWCREIWETIPDAKIVRFGPQGDTKVSTKKKGKRSKGEKALAEETNTRKALRDTLALLSMGGHKKPWVRAPRKSWAKPEGAEFYVLGRNQAKWMSDWAGIADQQEGFDGITHEHSLSSKSIIVERENIKDENGYQVYDDQGRPATKAILGRVHYCPRCGTTVLDKRGTPVAKKALTNVKNVSQQRCQGKFLKSIFDVARPSVPGGDTIELPARYAHHKAGQKVKHAGRDWLVMECNEPLYNYTSRPYRWSPANVIQRKLNGMFQYLLIDESHEQKSDQSGQSMACSKLIGAVDHVLAMTGTIIGGYANHLYPLMMRITPKTLREEGYEWGKDMEFSKTYGRIRTVVTTVEEDPMSNVKGRVTSMRKAKSGTRGAKNYVDPGVMPTMFARHMMETSIFLTLEELADNLPDLFEYVGGMPAPEPPRQVGESQEDYEFRLDLDERNRAGWFDVACPMAPEQKQEYDRVVDIMTAENKELIKKGSMKFLGAMLWTGLDYPDRPYGWGHDPDVRKAFEEARQALIAEGDLEGAAKLQLGHTVGYWEKPHNKQWDNFHGVVTPADLPQDVVYPKEQTLIDICQQQHAEGRQSWVYVNITNKRDIQPRLKGLLEAQGLKVGILRSSTCEPIDREQWIEENGRDYDVMLSHPELVKTGLDLFSKKQGGHNYPTIIFYETGYNLFTMRQAARRAWRIGQPMDCRIYYLYYRETMQHKAMQLMSRKMSAAQALEGKFSEDGLAAMAGEENMQMALAKQLSQRISEADMQRNWGKVKSGPKKKISSKLDMLSQEAQNEINAATAAQIIAETLEEQQAKPIPIEAAGEFKGVLERIAEVDKNFGVLQTLNRPAPVAGDGETLFHPLHAFKVPVVAEEEWEDAEPEKEGLDEKTGEEFEIEPKPAETIQMPEDKRSVCGKHLGYGDSAFHVGICEECYDEYEPEPVLKVVSDDKPEDEEEDFEIPELTPEIMMKMFANMQANGLL